MLTHILLNVVLKHKSFMQICPKFCKLFYIETDQYHHISGSLVHLIVLSVDYLCQELAKLGLHFQTNFLTLNLIDNFIFQESNFMNFVIKKSARKLSICFIMR